MVSKLDSSFPKAYIKRFVVNVQSLKWGTIFYLSSLLSQIFPSYLKWRPCLYVSETPRLLHTTFNTYQSVLRSASKIAMLVNCYRINGHYRSLTIRKCHFEIYAHIQNLIELTWSHQASSHINYKFLDILKVIELKQLSFSFPCSVIYKTG